MKAKRLIYVAIFALIGLTCCVDRYVPTVATTDGNLLVVEGNLQASTTLQLSHTSALGPPTFIPETGATVWVENSNNSYKVFFQKKLNGQYTANLVLVESDTYRVGITIGNKNYYSDFVSVNNSPAIESLAWGVGADSHIEIYANSKNSNERSRFYRWNFTETWEYLSAYESILKYDGQIKIRTPTELIHRCYKTAESPDIIIGSTTLLSENNISNFPVRSINPETDPRLDNRYSILVRQYSLTREAFEFWQIMQKNTQNLGTLFGPQPSQLKSNIHNVADPNEPVVGFISVGEMSTKRIFIAQSDLPEALRFNINRYPKCTISEVANNPTALSSVFNGPVYLPITSIGVYTPTGYMYAPKECVDCRYDGGVLQKPDFW